MTPNILSVRSVRRLIGRISFLFFCATAVFSFSSNAARADTGGRPFAPTLLSSLQKSEGSAANSFSSAVAGNEEVIKAVIAVSDPKQAHKVKLWFGNRTPLKAGEIVALSFKVRTVDLIQYGNVGVFASSAPTFSKAINFSAIRPDPIWQREKVVFSVPEDMAPGNLRIQFLFGAESQNVEVSDLRALVFPSATPNNAVERVLGFTSDEPRRVFSGDPLAAFRFMSVNAADQMSIVQATEPGIKGHLRAVIESPSEHGQAHLISMSVQSGHAVASGELVAALFYARNPVKGQDGRVAWYSQGLPDTKTPLSSYKFDTATSWQSHLNVFAVDKDRGPRQMLFSFHLGEQAQIFELGTLIMRVFPAGATQDQIKAVMGSVKLN